MRIIVADHHPQVLEALKTMVQAEPGFDLIGGVKNTQDLLMLAEEQFPDLVLMDKELPSGPLEDLITGLHQLAPSPVVIVMSSKLECSRVALKAGADAFVSKGDQPDWLLDKLRKYSKSN